MGGTESPQQKKIHRIKLFIVNFTQFCIKFLSIGRNKKKMYFFFLQVSFFYLSLPLKIIHKMSSLQMYKVRVLSSDIKSVEIIESCSSYSEAVERFLFYVHLALEFSLSVRCVNIFKGKKCINLFTNH